MRKIVFKGLHYNRKELQGLLRAFCSGNLDRIINPSPAVVGVEAYQGFEGLKAFSLAQKIDSQRLGEAILRLSDTERGVLLSYYIDGFLLSDLAIALNLPSEEKARDLLLKAEKSLLEYTLNGTEESPPKPASSQVAC